MSMFARLAMRALDLTYLRYLMASVGALAVDTGIFALLIAMGMNSMLSSAIGYSVGIIAHWLASSRTVFVGRVSEGGLDRSRQKAMFVVTALVGLAATTMIVGAGDVLGWHPYVSKIVAVVISFQLAYVLRARFIFKKGTAA